MSSWDELLNNWFSDDVKYEYWENENVAEQQGRSLAADGELSALVPMYFLFLGLLLGALTMYFQENYAPFFPYAAFLVLEGVFVGWFRSLFTTKEAADYEILISIDQWKSIDPFLLMAIFLPALLFADGMRINVHKFMKMFGQALMLSLPGVLANVLIMGMVARYLFEWEWYACFLFGAVLGATDPVAIVLLLEDAGAPQKLTILLSSESHLSDLCTLVIFKVFLDLVKDGGNLIFADAGTVVLNGFSLIVFGPVVGIAMGYLAYWFIRQSTLPSENADTMIQVAVTISLAYISFIVAEHNLRGNGVLASVSASWVIAAYAWPAFSNRETMRDVWDAISYLGNTLVFLLAGVILGNSLGGNLGSVDLGFNSLNGTVADLQTANDTLYQIQASDVEKGFLVYAFLMASRFTIVVVLFPFMKFIGEYGFYLNEAAVVAWGGIRGVVTIILGIVVFNLREFADVDEAERPDCNDTSQVFQGVDNTICNLETNFKGPNFQEELIRFYFVVGFVTLLTIVINFLTMPYVMKCLRIFKRSKYKKRLLAHVDRRIQSKAEETLEKLKSQGLYDEVNMDLVSKMITGIEKIRETRMKEERGIISSYLDMNELKTMQRAENYRKQRRGWFGFGSSSPEMEDEEQDRATKLPGRINPDDVTIDDCNIRFLYQVRQLFLNAVLANYWKQIKKGILPKTSSAALQLIYSAEVGLDNVRNDMLDDFSPLGLPEDLEADERLWYRRFFSCIDKWLPDFITIDNYYGEKWHNAVRERAIFICSCYIQAHTYAQKQVAKYVGADEDIDTYEEAYVIKESRELCARAQAYIDRVLEHESANIVGLVESVKVASTILEEQRRFITELKEQGIVEPAYGFAQMNLLRHDQELIKSIRRGNIKLYAKRRSQNSATSSGRSLLDRLQKSLGRDKKKEGNKDDAKVVAIDDGEEENEGATNDFYGADDNDDDDLDR